MTPTYNIDSQNLPYQTRLELWETGFGLQQIDGLEPSTYMRSLAKEQIEGRLSYQQVYEEISRYHRETSDVTQEADLVSLRIAELLSSDAFKFAPTSLQMIHKELFVGVLPQGIPVGRYRTYNITKPEPVLNGASVIYDDYRTIEASLNYDFEQERLFDYRGRTLPDMVEHLKAFLSGIWQIHPFGEGNTRTITVFMIKYLRSFGFDVDNTLFQNHARYFRDALVLNNAKLLQKKPEYLTCFFENLLLGCQHQLSLEELYTAQD